MKKLAAFLFLIFLITACHDESTINVNNLRCELLTNPQGIENPNPRLSWEINSDTRGLKQNKYHIIVSTTPDKLNTNEGDLWDSQMITSGKSINVEYGGKPLESRKACYWKVRVTTNQGVSKWSRPALWTMGLMDATDWQAQWIGLDKSFKNDVFDRTNSRLSARYFRKEFSDDTKPEKATLYVSGLGLYKLFINGKKIGDQELSPTPTDYSKVVKYNTFDVTDALTQGENVIATVLGNGRFFSMRPPGVIHNAIPEVRHFGFPKMILQLEIDYADGSKKIIASDDSWKVTADGPIIANNEFDGEEYDATKEMHGWNTPGFDDNKWLQVELVQAPEGKLEAQLNRNIKVMETVRPKTITELKKGTHILDMGQNMVGWLRMNVKGKKGDKVKLRFAETLKDDGSLYMDNIRAALVTDIYTLNGADLETWEPSFTYHGFRYVEITGYPGTPTVDDFEGQVVYDEMEIIGQFETSNPTINQIYKNSCWGIRGNYRGMPTDCPQRDERMGWLGDRAVGSYGESFIFNNYHLYSKWLDDIEQAQRETGSIADIAPNYWSMYSDNMTWPGTYLIIANMLYEQFGDKTPIVKHYESMKKWMKYMQKTYLIDNIMSKDTYGDWCMPPESPELIHSVDASRKTDGAVLGTTFYYRMLLLLERFAEIQGKTDDIKNFSEEAVAVKEAYNNKFFNKDNAQYSNNTVTANLLSLCYGMAPEGYEKKVFTNIINKTEDEFDSHVSTGLVGIQWLMRGLSDYGRADLAYKIATNRDYPSWGYMIENDATTIWELWNGNTADPAMNSHNHVMLLGDMLVWCYEYLAGIRNEPNSIGFEKIMMHPYPVDGLDYVTASYQSVHGTIKSDWKKSEDIFQWNITIPGNTTAIIYIPATSKNNITEGGKSISSAKGIKFVKIDGQYAIFEIGSGDYNFISQIK